MGARIARIGNELAHRAVGDDQPRRFYRRYFVHTGTLAKTIDRRKSAPLQLENAEKLESGQVRSGQVRSGRARSGQARSGRARAKQVRGGQVGASRRVFADLSSRDGGCAVRCETGAE